MYLCDTNVWLALTLPDHTHHAAAREWLETVDEPDTILFCRSTQQSLLRLLTSQPMMVRYGDRALTNFEAWAAYDALMDDDRIVFLNTEPAGLEDYWREYAARENASTKLWMDAYLAAFARAGGYCLVTIDRAFRQYEGLDLLLLTDA